MLGRSNLMHAELADEITRIAAPIYAALLAPWIAAQHRPLPASTLSELRRHAIQQALALRLDVIETPT